MPGIAAQPGLPARISQAMARRVSPQSLAVFRIALGALLVVDCWRSVRHDRIHRHWIEPEVHFAYPGFGWVTPLAEPWIHLAWMAMGALAVMGWWGFSAGSRSSR